MPTITISKNLIKKDRLILMDKKDFERLVEENKELGSAIDAILAGELALRQGKTRAFKAFLKSNFPQYAKN